MGTKIVNMLLSRKRTAIFGLPKYRGIWNAIKKHIPNFCVKGGKLSRYGNAN